MIAFETGLAQVLAKSLEPEVESISLNQALGRITAARKIAAIDVPSVDNSAMDGYAVRCADFARGNTFTVSQRIAAGDLALALEPVSVARIFTGAMIPAGADAVILQEDSQSLVDSNQVTFSETPSLGQHIRLAGQDIRYQSEVVAKGHRLSPGDIGLLASVGVSKLQCYRPLTVAFFSTGDELKDPDQALEPGQIYNSNRYFLAARIAECGAIPLDLGRCPDDAASTAQFLLQAAEQADCVITTGGMSVGEEDYVRQQVEALGFIDFWKLAIKPGKPVAFGQLQGTAFFGLPGNPVSAYVTFHLLVRPWLLKSMGLANLVDIDLANASLTGYSATANFERNNRGRRLDFLRGVARINEEGQLIADLFDNQSSGVLSSISAANILIPMAAGQKLTAGDHCTILPLSCFGELKI
ncbi:MAG: molybdopterin molybdotransferase MoeA [Pseudomonadales bacterium]|nr:molybdopterin molybdotransferase MoeA [Pseudomonadales bacterium]